MPRIDTKVCSLALNVGAPQPCPQTSVSTFWEASPAGFSGRCGIERLGLDHLGPAVSGFLIARRELRLQTSRPELPILPHPPGF
jgi:hypothetical protein